MGRKTANVAKYFFLSLFFVFLFQVQTLAKFYAGNSLQESNVYTKKYKELLFVADDVPGWKNIYRQAKASGVQTYILDVNKDFFDQLTEKLELKSAYDVIHIITHGKKGKIKFGHQEIDKNVLLKRKNELTFIKNSLKRKGAIYLYGCNIAKGEGRVFLDTFARLTVPNVAASNDITGVGGDWELEVVAANGKIDLPTLRYYLPYTRLDIWETFKSKTGAVLLGLAAAVEVTAGTVVKMGASTIEGIAEFGLYGVDYTGRAVLTLMDYTTISQVFLTQEEFDEYREIYKGFFDVLHKRVSDLREKVDHWTDQKFMLSAVNLGMMAAASWDGDINNAKFYSTIEAYTEEYPTAGKILTKGTSVAADWIPVVASLGTAGILKGPKVVKSAGKYINEVSKTIKEVVKNPQKGALPKIKASLERAKEGIKNLAKPIHGVKGSIATIYANIKLQHALYFKAYDIFKGLKTFKTFTKEAILRKELYKSLGFTKQQYLELVKLAKKMNVKIVVRKPNPASVEKLRKRIVNLGKGVKAKVLFKPLWMKAKTATPEDIFIHPKFLEKMKNAKNKEDLKDVMKEFDESFSGVVAVYKPVTTVTKPMVSMYQEYVKNYLKRSLGRQDADSYWDMIKEINGNRLPKSEREIDALFQNSEFIEKFEKVAKKRLEDRIKKQADNYKEFKDFGKKDASEAYQDGVVALGKGERIEVDELGRVVKIDAKGNKSVFAADADLMTFVDNKTGNLITDENRLLEIERELQLFSKEAGIEHGSIFSFHVTKFIEGSKEYSKYRKLINKRVSVYTNKIFGSMKRGKIELPSELANDRVLKTELEMLQHEFNKIDFSKLDATARENVEKMYQAKISDMIKEREMAKLWYKIKLGLLRDGFKDEALLSIAPSGEVGTHSLKFVKDLYDTADSLYAFEESAKRIYNTLKMYEKEITTVAIGSTGQLLADDSVEASQNENKMQTTDVAIETQECRELFPGHSFGEWTSDANFVMIKKDGEVIPVGNGFADAGFDPDKILKMNIVDVFSNSHAFAAITAEGDVVAWGNRTYGGFIDIDHDNEEDELHNVKRIYSTKRAFAALKKDGSVVAWGAFGNGSFDYGGMLDINHDTQLDRLNNIKEIFSNEAAFAALKEDSSVVTWGREKYGGVIDLNHDGIPDELTNVKRVYSSRCAFAALKENGSVVAWGSPECGGYLANSLNGVKEIYATYNAFAALKEDGSVVAWGAIGKGGFLDLDNDGKKDLLQDVRQIVASKGAFAALKTDGTVVVWGDRLDGGIYGYPKTFESYYEKVKRKLKNVKRLFSSGSGFAALKEDNSLISWGHSYIKEIENVKSVYSNSSSFVALKENGSVVAWGDHVSGGRLDLDGDNKTDELFDVVDIVSNDSGFTALKSDGTAVTWGERRFKITDVKKIYPDLCHKYKNSIVQSSKRKRGKIEIRFYDNSTVYQETLTEQDTIYSINVKLLEPAKEEVTFKLELNSYTATAEEGIDYEVYLDRVTFKPGEYMKSFSIDIKDNDTYEGDRIIAFDIVQEDDPFNRIHFYMLLKDDEKDLPPILTGVDAIFNEGERAEVVVKLSKPATEEITVAYKPIKAFKEYYAIEGVDYTYDQQGLITFKPGEQIKRIYFDIVDDNIPEPREYFTIEFEEVLNGDPRVIIHPTQSRANVIILDNDILWKKLWDLLVNNTVAQAVIKKVAMVPTLEAIKHVKDAITDKLPAEVKEKITQNFVKYMLAIKFDQPLENEGKAENYIVKKSGVTRDIATYKVLATMIDPNDPSVVFAVLDRPIEADTRIDVQYKASSLYEVILPAGLPQGVVSKVTESKNLEVEEVEDISVIENSNEKFENSSSSVCAQVLTHAYNPQTGEERDFPTPCDVPEGWIVGYSTNSSSILSSSSSMSSENSSQSYSNSSSQISDIASSEEMSYETSSSDSNESVGKDAAIYMCEVLLEGVWVDGVGCTFPSDNSSLSASSSTFSSSSSDNAQNSFEIDLKSDIDALKDYLSSVGIFKATGYFLKYDFPDRGPAYDWIFVTPSGKVYQLLGNPPHEMNVFGWKKIGENDHICDETIVLPGQGCIDVWDHFDEKNVWIMIKLDDWDNDQSSSFDWVLFRPPELSPNGYSTSIYKLDGVNKNGTFRYKKVDNMRVYANEFGYTFYYDSDFISGQMTVN